MKIISDIGIQIPQVYLPKAGTDLTKWAVIACDQFTSEPEYWQEVEKIVGGGSVDLAHERYVLTLNAESKRPSILALRGPIVVDGTFKSPQVHPATGQIIARVGASVALGVALTPLAALLPLIDMGGHPDADCGALIEEATDNVRLRPTGPKPSRAKAG